MQGRFVVRTHRSREQWACENIIRQGGDPYMPMISERIKVKGRGFVQKARCLFPSYLFVQTNGQWHFLLGTFGVAEVLLVGKVPAVISERDIQALKDREIDGLIQLPSRPSKNKLIKGEPVRISSGLYSGFQGIYEGTATRDRERILLDYLGHKTRVLIGTSYLERVEGEENLPLR